MKKLLPKKWILFLVVLFANLVVCAQTATAPAGTGTSGDPYQIATLDNLYWVTQNTTSWAAGTYFIQTADIDASSTSSWHANAGFSPIGNSTTQFQGNYNGQGHSIDGLVISRPSTNNIGFFGYIGNTGVVANVGVTNVNFSGQGNVGGLAAILYLGNITNCYSTGTISTSLSEYYEGAGGLIGSNYGNISNSYSSCAVTGDDEIGGFVGVNNVGATIAKCYSEGNVTATASNAGGFVGFQIAMMGDAEIINCFSRGNVNGVGNIGGFVGKAQMNMGNAYIKKCYSTGSVSGTTSVGGFIGLDWSNANLSDNYFDAETDGLAATSSGTVEGFGSGATGKTTSEMKTEAIFTGWDFATIWEISSAVNNGYLAFQWMPDAPSQPLQLKFTTTADNRSIRLPLYGTVDCTVDWGDGSPVESFNIPGRKQHIFATAGTYTVSISGSLTQFGYYDTGNEVGWSGAGYLSEVVDFGSIGLTSLSGAFCDADNLSSVPASLPVTVTDLSYCFFLNDKASITNLNSWDVSHVTNMSAAFYKASAFNQNISTWDVSGVTNMADMFKRAFAFNQPIGTWDVSSVTNMEDMFRSAYAFDQPIGNWVVSSVTSMNGMFESASAFNQDISDWNVGSVTNMASMFDWATSFNQDISDWDVINVTDMSWMFSGASAFDQSLAGWDMSSISTMEDMFADVTLSTSNYDAILISWAAQTVNSTVVFGGGNSQYSAGLAATARGVLTGTPNNWTITDGGQVFTVTTQAATAITATTATGNGTIVSVGSGNATNRGVIYYPYSGADKIIGETDVTNIIETGDFGNTAFTATLTGLSVNAHYNARAHATNTVDGTKYGERVDFWTTARVPSAPGVINPTATSLDVVVNPNGNPADVLFAIQDSANALYVQADGTRTANVVWQTAAQWDTTKVTDLSTGVTYYFRVKAKNDNNEETAFSVSTGQNTCSNPTNGGEIGSEQQVCTGNTPAMLINTNGASNYGGTLEYKWQRSTTNASSGFEDILSSNSATYSPDPLTQTTWFKRLARVDCKSTWENAAESNTVTITVNQYVTPSVGISLTTGSNPCCPPDFVTFTATPTNGGTSPTYEWFKNGVSVASTAGYTFNPADGDEIYVVMTTSVQCYTTATATSNTATMEVISPETVTVSMRAIREPGYQVRFTAYPVNGGSSPVYTWYKNGVPVPGVTGPVLISTCQRGDEHKVVLTSSLPCTTPATSETMCTN